MKRVLIHGWVFAAIAMFGVCVHADEVITSYSTVNDDGSVNDQAGPMFGQSITVNIGADTPNASIPAIVFLGEVSFQYSSSNSGGQPSTVFLQLYDDFAVDGSSVPTAIGNLIAVSTNSLDLSGFTGSEQMTWSFGGDAIDKATSYSYIFANDTNAATVGNSGNLVGVGAELDVGDPYSGGQAFRGNGTNSDWDMAFEVRTQTSAIPEPTSIALLGMGLVGLVSSRRRRRS